MFPLYSYEHKYSLDNPEKNFYFFFFNIISGFLFRSIFLTHAYPYISKSMLLRSQLTSVLFWRSYQESSDGAGGSMKPRDVTNSIFASRQSALNRSFLRSDGTATLNKKLENVTVKKKQKLSTRNYEYDRIPLLFLRYRLPLACAT